MIIKRLKNKLLNFKIIINLIHYKEYKYSFSIPILLSYLNIPEDVVINFNLDILFLILSLLILYSFTKVIAYFCAIYFLKNYKIDDNYKKKNIRFFLFFTTLLKIAGNYSIYFHYIFF